MNGHDRVSLAFCGGVLKVLVLSAENQCTAIARCRNRFLWVFERIIGRFLELVDSRPIFELGGIIGRFGVGGLSADLGVGELSADLEMSGINGRF